MNEKLKKNIQAILFVAGGPVTIPELVKVLGKEEEEIKNALTELSNGLRDQGIVITQSKNTYQMATSPESSTAVKNYLQEQLRERLTEVALETLSIVAYKQPVSRAEIEAIRGVNSQYILRLLAQRGLIEKIPSPTDARVLLYETTHEFLHHLGISDVKELPDFEQITAAMEPPQTPA